MDGWMDVWMNSVKEIVCSSSPLSLQKPISTFLSSLLLLPWKESCKFLGFVTELNGFGFGIDRDHCCIWFLELFVCLFVSVSLYVVVVVWFLF